MLPILSIHIYVCVSWFVCVCYEHTYILKNRSYKCHHKLAKLYRYVFNIFNFDINGVKYSMSSHLTF